MKKLIFILFWLSSFSVFAQNEADRQAILNVLEKQRMDWNQGDLNGFMMSYAKTDSLLFVGKSGANYGWQTTLDNYKKGYPDKGAMGFLTFAIKKVEFLNVDIAFVLGSWHLKRDNDEPKGFFTLLLKKINGEWKIIVDHSS